MAEENPKQSTEAEERDIPEAVTESTEATGDGSRRAGRGSGSMSQRRNLRTSKPSWRRHKMRRSERRQTR